MKLRLGWISGQCFPAVRSNRLQNTSGETVEEMLLRMVSVCVFKKPKPPYSPIKGCTMALGMNRHLPWNMHQPDPG